MKNILEAADLKIRVIPLSCNKTIGSLNSAWTDGKDVIGGEPVQFFKMSLANVIIYLFEVSKGPSSVNSLSDSSIVLKTDLTERCSKYLFDTF